MPRSLYKPLSPSSRSLPPSQSLPLSKPPQLSKKLCCLVLVVIQFFVYYKAIYSVRLRPTLGALRKYGRKKVLCLSDVVALVAVFIFEQSACRTAMPMHIDLQQNTVRKKERQTPSVSLCTYRVSCVFVANWKWQE